MVSDGVEVFRTRDWKVIWQITTHPTVWDRVTDDLSPEPQTWTPVRDEACIYLLARAAGNVLGYCAFYPKNGITYEAHICFLPEAYGAKSVDAFHQMLAWMWKNTQARRIVGEINRENRLAVRFALRVGAKAYGVNKGTLLKGGKLLDRVAFGISKP